MTAARKWKWRGSPTPKDSRRRWRGGGAEMAGLTLEWQVFLRGIEKRIMDIEEELASFPGLTLFDLDHLRISKLQGQLEAFEEVRDYIKGEMK